MSIFKKILFSTFFFFLPVALFAETLECSSKSVSTEFSDSGEPIKTIFEGNVRIVAENIAIECEKAVFEHTTSQLTIDSEAKISNKEFTLVAGKTYYNFDSLTGKFVDAKLSYGEFIIRAPVVEKKTDLIYTESSIFTSCDRESPHYHLYCGRLQLTEKKLIVKNLKIYFGKIPVFYFPKYSYNIKTKKPLFILSTGYKTEIGNGISIIFNNSPENKKIEMEERIDIGFQGIGAGLTIQDSTLPDTSSSIKKFDSYVFKRYGNYDLKYGFIAEFQNEFAHRQNVILDWRWMKDNQFFRRYLYDEYLRKSKNPNYFSYSKPFSEGFFNIQIADSAHEDFLSPSKIPEIQLSFPYINIGRLLGSFDIIPTRFVDNDGNEYQRIATQADLELPIAKGYVKISPFIRLRNIYYSQEREEINNLVFSPGINIGLLAKKSTDSTTIYFSPSFSIFSNYPSKKYTGYDFDSYDFNPDGTFCSANLAWDFWVAGERTGNITLMNLYDAKRTKFMDSILLWNFKPAKRWSFFGQEIFNISKGGMKQMDNNIVFNGENLRFGFGNSYFSGHFNGLSANVDKRAGDWQFGGSVNYDLDKNKFTSQRYYIQKQFHCLTAGIVYSRTSTSYIGFFIAPSVFSSKRL